MLDLPGMVVAQAIGELDLIQRVLIEPVLVAGMPWAGQLQFIENAEFHGGASEEEHARKFIRCKRRRNAVSLEETAASYSAAAFIASGLRHWCSNSASFFLAFSRCASLMWP